MARVINITDKIKTEEKYIEIGEKRIRVDDSKNAVFEVYAMIEDTLTPALMHRVLERLIGKEAAQELGDISFEAYKCIFFAVFALVQGKEYEEVEQNFRA